MSVDSATKSFSKMELQEANKHAHEAAEATTQTRTDFSHRNKDDKIPATTSDKGRTIDDDAIKLFVGQVPRTMTKEELMPMFIEFGDVFSLSIIKHRITNQHAGCAFLTFYTRAAADKAIAVLHDKRVLPGMKNAMQVKPAHGEFQSKLFVGMIPHACTASEIESIFAPFGDIVELNLLKRRSRILNKGCAFIQFKYKHQALKAIKELHGKHLIKGSDTPLVVKFADNRKARKTMGRGRWRGDLMPHYGMPSGGYQDMRHGHPNAHPYHSNYYPSPISSYQPHPHAGTRWHGWAPVYFDTPSYYGGPNSGEMYHNSHMQYTSPSMPYFGRGPPMQPRTPPNGGASPPTSVPAHFSPTTASADELVDTAKASGNTE